ncbi:unnamed protein product [Sphagnum troendelagicum]|uniref:Phosphate transporter PHO1 n=1 Tax=Sphagnum troendelagicum TaxID=128251 RepID=A0ABP0US22_9BRYO
MVKFSKQLEGQLVPEWRDAYCNYKQLKKDVKRIKQERLLQNGSIIPAGSADSSTLRRSLSSLQQNISGRLGRSLSYKNRLPGELLVLHKKDRRDVQHGDSTVYETELMEPLGHAEQDRAFFNRLDAQLNKINRFYKLKETEYIAQARHLERQLLALFHVQEALARQKLILQSSSKSSGEENSNSSSDDESIEVSENVQPKNPSRSDTGRIMRSRAGVSSREEHHESIMSPFHTVRGKGDYDSRLQKLRDSNVEPENNKSVRDHARFADRESRNIIQDMIDLSLSQKKINGSEKMLRTAFIEFYRGLGLLKSYSSLNIVAFAKILKKYDKVVKWNLAPMYIKEVERSYFASSDKVTKLITRVEDIFTKHFSHHDRRKAMAQLRPMQEHGGHTTTFFLGIFSGSTAGLLVAFILILLTQPDYRIMAGKEYMKSVFIIFSTLGLLLLHMYMYGWNVYAWQRTRINYGFIFEFSPGTELRYREVLLICTALSSMLLGTMIVHIIASAKEAPNYNHSEWAPMAITLVFLVMLLIPANILYKSSRYFFLRCFRRIVFAPFYKVVLSDFFLGDQLTSQVASFRNFEFMLCYYSGGYFQHRNDSACSDNMTFKLLMYVFSLLPYWWRFLQCLRRWRDEGDKLQLYNSGKYMSAMVAVVLRLAYVSHSSIALLVLFVLSSCFATLYQVYWDVVVDWGLLQQNSKNPGLRDNLILKRKYLYYISMWLNALLRLAWISSIQPLNGIPGFSQPAWSVIFAALEVIRRGQWNFYRLENEHLNNVGKYRAVKTVPLPFKEFQGGSV